MEYRCFLWSDKFSLINNRVSSADKHGDRRWDDMRCCLCSEVARLDMEEQSLAFYLCSRG